MFAQTNPGLGNASNDGHECLTSSGTYSTSGSWYGTEVEAKAKSLEAQLQIVKDLSTIKPSQSRYISVLLDLQKVCQYRFDLHHCTFQVTSDPNLVP